MLEKRVGTVSAALPLTSVNHISRVCRSLDASIDFYHNVLGFVPVKRPGSFDFQGAWLFNYGMGVHLLQSEDPQGMPAVKTKINPKDDHISFQCESMVLVERKLKEMGIEYAHGKVEEGGIYVDQLFFHDPDGFMIEICNCDNIPVIPLLLLDDQPVTKLRKRVSFNKMQQQQQQQLMMMHAPAAELAKEPAFHG